MRKHRYSLRELQLKHSHSALWLKVRKLLYSITHASCWKALSHGVAPSIEHLGVLRTLDFDGIIDAGANRGQFSLAARIARPDAQIVAFEPIPAEASLFELVHGTAGNVKLIRSALGPDTGTATLHLSQSADSSSLLPIGDRQRQLFPETAEVGVLEVPVHRLDDFLSEVSACQRLLLKIDVQGFELQVLRGATETLKKCKFIYVECSDEVLYPGQALREEVNSFLEERGFAESGRFNVFSQDDKPIQADYLFVSKAASLI